MNPSSTTSSTKNGILAGNAVLWAGGRVDANYNLNNQTETFTYDTDKLHSRLTGWKVNGQTVASLVYGDNGNITKKSDVSTASNSYKYQHPQGKPHAVTAVSSPTAGFAKESYPQSVDYNSFNKVEKIVNHDPGNHYQVRLLYGPDNQRKRTFLNEVTGHPGVPEILKYFVDNYEYEYRNEAYRHLHYLNGPDGLFAIMVKEGTTETMYYVHKDYLGSISAITDASGNLVESLSYDPWGRRRNPSDWTDYNISSTLFDRGFTGHEHLPQFGLINMNGRVYDPFLARFLSPDPFIQAPTYTQNYNRYSYAWNNPLKYFDPSGYINQYPDEGGIPTRHRDGGSGPATFVPSSMVNIWNSGGSFGPGSGRHWSDPYRSVWGNFMLGSRSSFINIYGQNAHNNYVSYYTGDNNRFVWNPVAGDEVYRESGKGYVNIYYSGGWVKASPFTGPAFGGGVPVYSNALMDGPGASGHGSVSCLSKGWNSGIARFYFPDVIYINGSIVLTFLGGGAADIGLALPLRGKTAGTVYLYNTLKGKAGLHGGVSFNFGRSYYLGSIDLFDFEETFGGNSSGVEGDYLFLGSSISVSESDRYDNLLISIDFGFGPGIGGSANIGAKTYNFPLFRIW